MSLLHHKSPRYCLMWHTAAVPIGNRRVKQHVKGADIVQKAMFIALPQLPLVLKTYVAV